MNIIEFVQMLKQPDAWTAMNLRDKKRYIGNFSIRKWNELFFDFTII